jgi:hypothetical protein
MGADYNDMIAKLQIQLGQQQQQNNPSLFGLQAATDPNTTAALLKRLQDQQYVAEQGNPPNSDWASQFGQAGKKDAARAGQNLAGIFGIGQPPQMDNSGVMAQRQAITQGKGQLSDLLSGGADPNAAQIQVLTKLAQAGVPGAAEQLEKANDNAQKLATARATAYMDTAKGNASTDEISNRAAQRTMDQKKFDQGTAKDTWTTIAQGNGYIVQKNGLGEISTKKNSDASSSAAASVTPDGMKSMLDYYHTNGALPPGVTRSPAMASMFWQAEGQYQTATGNNAAAATANKLELHSLNADTAKTQTAMGATSAYLSTMDKNIEKARTLGNQLDFSDVTGFNKALQAWDRGTSDPKYAKYNVFFSSVATEYAKLSSGNMGNTTVSDSQRHETQQIINSGIGNGGMNGIFDALKEEGANKVAGYQEHLDQNMQRIRGFGSNERGGLPQTAPRGAPQGAASTPQPSTPPAQNAQGWTLHTDKFGKQAYVSPDGKQFQAVGSAR